MNTVCDDLRKAEAWAANHPPRSAAGYHATYYYFTDHLGSCSKTFYRIMWYHTEGGSAVNTLIDSGVESSDTTYYPYGKFYTYERNAARHFTGKEKEGFPVAGSYDSGIYYFGGRYYDQTLGMFIQKDPMMQNPSPYLYTNGNPVNRIDPTGLVDETNIPDTYYQEWIKNGGHSAGGTTVGAPQLAALAGQQGVSLRSTTIYASAGSTTKSMIASALKFINGSASSGSSVSSSGSVSSSAPGGEGNEQLVTDPRNFNMSISSGLDAGVVKFAELKIITTIIGPNGEPIPIVNDSNTGINTIGFPGKQTDNTYFYNNVYPFLSSFGSNVWGVVLNFLNPGRPIYRFPIETIQKFLEPRPAGASPYPQENK